MSMPSFCSSINRWLRASRMPQAHSAKGCPTSVYARLMSHYRGSFPYSSGSGRWSPQAPLSSACWRMSLMLRPSYCGSDRYRT